jgi:drug/metabolite transporter (DMT)-like permease
MVHARLDPGAGPWFCTLYGLAPRFLVALVVLAAVQGRGALDFSRAELMQGIVVGLFAAAAMALQYDGLRFTAASTSAFLTQFYAIMIPVWLAFRTRRSPGAVVWVSCALVLAGVSILGHFDWGRMRFGRGERETLLSSVFFMGQILLIGRKKFAANRAVRVTLVMFATMALVFSAIAVRVAPTGTALLLPWESPAWVALTLLLALFCTLGAFTIMNVWQPVISVTEAGLIYCSEPIFGSVLALILPAVFSRWGGIDYANEHATASLLVGGGLITAANLLIQLKPPPA